MAHRASGEVAGGAPGVGRGWEGRLWARKESEGQGATARSLTFLVPGGSRSAAAGVRLDILEQRLVDFADDCGVRVSFVSRTQE